MLAREGIIRWAFSVFPARGARPLLDRSSAVRYAESSKSLQARRESHMTNRRNDKWYEPGAETQQRPIVPLPADTFEDKHVASLHYRRLNDWLDEAFEECKKNGGFDDLPGKGKPVEVPTEDVMQSIMKNAKIPPPWILLRQEIHTSIEYTLELLRAMPEHPSIDENIREINKKITELNFQAPSLSLHRRKVTRQTLKEQHERWR
jgi:hypothetical protein